MEKNDLTNANCVADNSDDTIILEFFEGVLKLLSCDELQ